MNGIASRGVNGFDGRPQLLRPLGAPNGPALVDRYRQDAMNYTQREKPHSNTVCSLATRASL
jgi:hypothetical protein